MTDKTLPKYNFVGKSGLKVFPLCLGVMPWGTNPKWTSWGIQSKEEDCEKILRKYVEIGGNFIDTACNYHQGGSEETLAAMIKKCEINRDDLVIATKFTSPMNSSDPNYVGNGKKNLKRSVEGSLKRLGTDYIDILYAHFWTFDTDPYSLLRSMNDLIRAGKVLHIGLSDAPAYILSKMNTIAKYIGLDPFIMYQGEYSLLERSMEFELQPCCKDENVGIIPWGTVSSGRLSGVKKSEETSRKKPVPDHFVPVQKKVAEIAANMGVSPAVIAQRWVLDNPQVPSILIGPRTYKQFEDTIAVLDCKLNEEQREELNEISKRCPELTFPAKYIGNKNSDVKWQFLSGKGFDLEEGI